MTTATLRRLRLLLGTAFLFSATVVLAANKAPDAPKLNMTDARKPSSGSCDNQSNPCGGGGETCQANMCYCKEGSAHCGKSGYPRDCIDLSQDDDNCGKCGNACAPGADQRNSTPAEKQQKCVAGKCVSYAEWDKAYMQKVYDDQKQRDQAEADQKKHLAELEKKLKGGRLDVFNQYSEPTKFEGGASVEKATKWIFHRFVDQTQSFCSIEFAFKGNKVVKKRKIGEGCIYVD
jgi:hypothetical protein